MSATNKILFLLLLTSELVVAQSYEEEALLFSRPGISGTARSIGSAGAFGSVGADLGSVAINPAGIALYRSSDFSISPGLQIGKNETQFRGNTTSASQSKVYFGQAGAAFTKLLKKAEKVNDFSFSPTKMVSFTFAINYQRQSMFSRTQRFDALNNSNSGMEYYANYLNETHRSLSLENYSPEPLLGFSTYLIDTVPGTFNYFSNVRAPLRQYGNINTKGANDEVSLTFGGNINDKFYFGAGLGVLILTHSSEYAFSESNSADTTGSFVNYDFASILRTSGIGVNARFGIIYRPASWMRLGLAYQIPSFYTLTESYEASINAYYNTGNYPASAVYAPIKYKLRTPMKGIASASFYLKEHGFFSVDYEFLNYGGSRYNFGSDFKAYSDEVNTQIKKYYSYGHVIHAGFEGSYKSLRLRAGYSFSGTPYKKDYRNQLNQAIDSKSYTEVMHKASIGAGYRGKRFYADMAYVIGFVKDAQFPYADFKLKNTNLSHNLILTIGWRLNKAIAGTRKKEKTEKDF